MQSSYTVCNFRLRITNTRPKGLEITINTTVFSHLKEELR